MSIESLGLSAERRELLALLLADEGIEPASEAEIRPRREGGDLPLSFAQQRLWFLQQLEGGAAYNVPAAVRLQGALDCAALASALSEIVRRHESLRTSFGLHDGQPVQQIAPPAALPLPVVDLEALAESAAFAEARRIGAEESHRPFDLSRTPLLRVALLRLQADEHVLLAVMHHIASDLWSRSVLLRELSLLYEAGLRRGPSPLPELPIQYADFALWQRRQLGEVLEPQLAYWQRQLAGVARLEVPSDRPRGAVQSARGRREPVVLARELSQILKTLARREAKTLFMTLLAGFQALLHRYTGQDDVAVGTPVANRKRVEIEGLIGLFLNTVVLRTDLGGNPSFHELLDRVHGVTVDAFAHDDLPFERLVDELQPERNLSRTPLFQVVFSLGSAEEVGRLHLAGLAVQPFPLEDRTAKFELNLLLAEGPAGITGALEHSTDLFDPATVRRMIGHLGELLAAAAVEPDRRIGDLPLLAAAERHQLLREWSDASAQRAGFCLHRRFEEQARLQPGAVAVVCGQERLTYDELNLRANRLAHYLRARGVGPEVLVGLCAERSLDLVVGLLAILKAGGAYLPIDPDYPAERRAYLIEDARAPVVLAQEALAADLRGTGADVVLLESDTFAGERGDDLPGGAEPGNLAYVIYTSGSTGRPKGVTIRHFHVARLFTATDGWLGFGPDDVWTLFHSFAFDFSVWELWGALLHGGRLVVVPYLVSRSPEAFHELLATEGVTVLNQTPSAFRQLIAADQAARRELALRWVIFGGEGLEFPSLRPWIELHGDDRPRLINMYGITETTVHVTFRQVVQADLIAGHTSRIGVPIPDLSVRLLDPHGGPVPSGVPGEICVGGAGLSSGYLGRPALTAERFVPDPFTVEPGGRLYRSGDLGRVRPDGDLEHLGRIDHQVKVRGFRIELGEIEAALAGHPGVHDTVVLARRDGGGDPRLVAYLIAAREPAPGPGELRAYLLETLPEYMVPAAFVSLETFPLTPNGKLDRAALPAPGHARPELEGAYVPPDTPEEEILAGVFARAIGVDQVGVHDNFFALGGDSIRSLQVIGLARERGLEISLQQVFQHQTVAELARRVSSGRAEALSSTPFSLVLAADRERLPQGLEDAYPLSVLQAGMLYHMALTPEEPPYHNVDAWLLRGRFEAGPLQWALDRAAARHEALRTSYDLGSFSEPLQLVHRAASIPLAVEDLRHLPTAAREAAVDTFMAAEKRRLFAGSDVPQVRCRVFLVGDDLFWFVLTENHAVWDGWSLHATLAEIFKDYFRLLAGEDPLPEPPPRVGYREFVALERAAIESEECRSFWREHLDGCTVLPLPAWPVPAEAGPRVRVRRMPLSQEVSLGVRRLARDAAVPLKSVALAAHLRALAVAAGQLDVLTGVISNGRPEVSGGDEVRGLFLNALPFRMQLGSGTWLDLARNAFEIERAMIPHRRYPLATLQKDRGGEPLFDQVFNYINFHVVEDLLQRGELEVLRFKGEEGTHFRMQIVFLPQEQRGSLILDIEYDSARLPAAQIETLGGYHLRVLEAMAAEPTERYDTAVLLSPAERHQLLVEWRDGGREALAERELLHELFQAQAARSPEALALIAGQERWSYQRLREEAEALARRLRGLGVGPEVPVGICLDRGPELLTAILATLLAGGAYVPLDPKYPAERLRFMLEDSMAPVVVTRERLEPLVRARGARSVLLEQPGEPAEMKTIPGPAVAPANPAYVMYTSGSTGRPKGVVVEHRAAVAFVAWSAGLFSPRELARVLFSTSICFDLSVFEMFVPLATGGTVVLADDALHLLQLPAADEVTLINTVPSAMATLVELDAVPASARTVNLAGEPLRRPLVEAVHGVGSIGRLVNLYGPTEDTVYATLALAKQDWPADPPIGRPVVGTRAYVLDAALAPVPAGAAGELYLGGTGLARGYLRRPDVTAERFVPDPFAAMVGEPGERLYRTGDLVRRRLDGALDFVGRLDHQVKVRGYRIELGEIETVLAAHPGVREVVVVARAQAEGEPRLVAFLAPSGELAPAEADLRAALAERLPEYMVPAGFVVLPALPRTPNGKVDRNALPEFRPQTGETFVAPRTPVEERLAAIWCDVLRLERVGVHDNFFALGGDSLRSIRAVSRANRAGLRLGPRDLFERPTIAELAGVVELDEGSEGTGLPEAVSPSSAEVEDVYRLTPVQHGMVLFHVLNPGSAVYFSRLVVPLRGDLDSEVLHRACERLVERHGVLRTHFVWEGMDEPMQVVSRVASMPWRQEDWRGLPAEEQQARLRDLVGAELRALDLWRGPVMRAALVRLDQEDHRLVWVWHHAALDGWSVDLLSRERDALYEHLRRGEEAALPQAPPFRTYLDWLSRRDPGESERFWRAALEDFSSPTPLPAERASSAEIPPGSARQRIDLTEEATAAVAAFARRHGLTIGTLVAGAWAALLGRYCGEDEVVFGLVSSGRPADLPEVESIAGVFLATPPVRVRLAADATILCWLRALQESVQRLREHEHVPLPEIQRSTAVPLSRPLFESLVIVQARRDEAGESMAGRIVRSQDREAQPLSLFALPGQRLSLRFSYDAQRFEDLAVTRLLGHLEILLAAVARDAEQRLADVPLLTSSELQQILFEWNDPECAGAHGDSFPALFAAQVRRTPEAVAAVWGDRRLTYAELDLASDRLAGRLERGGVIPGSVVALLGSRSLDFLAAVLAVFKAGAAYLPLDPTHPPRRWAHLLDEARPAMTLAEARLGNALAMALEDSPRRARIGPLSVLEEVATATSVRTIDPASLAYVIYTSGSTGVPKGAMVEHRGMLNHLRAKVDALELTSLDVVAQTASQCFDISVWQLLAALLVGGRTAILEDAVAQDPRRLALAVTDHGITVLETVPSLLRLFLEEIEGNEGLAPLRWLIPTGEALPPDLCRLWLQRFPEVPLLNAYGPTECSDDVSHQRIASPPESGLSRVPIGRPLTNLRLYVLDRQMRLTPAGVAGELCAGGFGVGRGYLGDPARTAERFVPDPFSTASGGRLYRTGDLARYLPGGEIDFLGRIDHQVKLHGFRIELGEIETALRLHPGIGDAAVLLREDRPGDPRLVAYVVPAGDAVPAEETLRSFLRDRLPEPMVPTVFLALPALPLTPNGKLDRKALPTPADPDQPQRAVVAPRTAAEELVAGIWSEVLGVMGIGAEDDFFDLGGHSLRAIQVASRIRRTFGVELPLARLFEVTTVAALAAAIEKELDVGAGRTRPPALRPVSRERALPLSFSQRRQWFLDQLEPGNPAYTMPGSVQLASSVAPAFLESALSEILRRHEVLRTTFQAVEGEPRQVIAPSAPLHLPLIDLRGLAPHLTETEGRRVAAAEAQRPFDLSRGPLIRLRLLLLPRGNVLLFPMHHIVSDGWSMGILLRELSSIYEAHAAGRPSPLSELPLQYADYAVWQEEWQQGEVLASQLAWWREQLAGAPPLLALPTDRPRPALQTFRGARQQMPLPAGLDEQLMALSRRHGVTLFMTFLGSFATLLHRYTGETDLSIGTYIAGRGQSEIEGLIGFFVNTLVLRNPLPQGGSFEELLERVRQVTLGAFAHQDLPFEKLLEELRPERNLRHTPLFQVMLEFQNTSLPGSRLIPAPEGSIVPGRANFDLTLWVRQVGGDLGVSFGYNRDLFDDTTITRLAEHFRILLAGVADGAAQALVDVPLLPAAERHQLVYEWSRTSTPVPTAPPLVHEAIGARAAFSPEATAAVWQGKTLSYGELDRWAELLARRLQGLGVGPETRVGLCLERSPEMLVGLLGILKAGGAYLPLDPANPAERLAFLVRDSLSPVLLTSRPWLDRLPTGPEIILLDDPSPLAAERGVGQTASGGNLAYVIYTSGSTGAPKGVEVAHGSLALYTALAVEELGLSPVDRVLQFASISFDTAAEEIFPCLSAGATLVLRDEAMLGSPAAFLDRCGQAGVTVLDLPTAYWTELALALAAGEAILPESVRLVVIGGEKAPAAAVAAWWRAVGPRSRLLNTYGPTEATIVTTICDLSGEEGRMEAPIGSPVPHARTYVADANLQPVPIGAAGELLIGGDGLARGYLGRPDLTAERFMPDSLGEVPGARVYLSGDRVRQRTDGRLEFLGRVDRQVKIRGFRVELEEIEEALRLHDRVRDAAVAIWPDAAGPRLAAYVVPQGDLTDAADLRRFLRSRLPDYMVPASFDLLEALPLTSTGKIDRRALPKPGASAADAQEVAPPETEIEALLVRIWGEVLRVDPIGIRDNFFDAGGHSLLATQVLARVRDRLNVDLPLLALFEMPTIEELALSIEEILLDRLEGMESAPAL